MESVNKWLIGLLIVAGIQWSCVKDPQDIPSVIGDNPVFGLEGFFGNVPVSIQAGNEGWTMLPVEQPSDSLTAYTAVFSKDGCLSDCSPSWTFILYQDLNAPGDPSLAFAQTVRTGDKTFLPSEMERDSFQISISAHPGLFMNGYNYWEDLNDASTSFFHDFHNTVGYQEDVNVCLQSLAYTGCQYSQCIHFDPATEVPCLAYIEPILENSRYLSLHVRPEGTPPFTYQWANGSAFSGIVIPLQDTTAVVYAAVTVTDARGNSTALTQTIKVQNGYVDACYFPITMSSTLVENSSPVVFAGRVEIVYRDEEGHIWRSSGGVQPFSPEWNIRQVDLYGQSPSGQTAYLVEAATKVFLFNGETGESRMLDTDRLSLAFSYN